MVEEIKRICCENSKNIIWTSHVARRMAERDISKEEILDAIEQGEVIKRYPDDRPYPSVLLYGNGLHVVCGLGKGKVSIVTVYRPSLDMWEPDMRTRRGRK